MDQFQREGLEFQWKIYNLLMVLKEGVPTSKQGLAKAVILWKITISTAI
jgi:hypothetical protein